MKRILVNGAGGFTGGHMVKRLKGETRPVQTGVGSAATGILAKQEVAFDPAPGHEVEVRELGVVRVHARQP